MIASTYYVAGMTCGNCVRHVTEELLDLDGVTEVVLDIEGALTITSVAPLAFDAVRIAVAEAGDYTLTTR